MKDISHIKNRDFSHLNNFPGDTGNPFDVILHKFNNLSKIPFLLYLFLIFFISGFVVLFQIKLWPWLFIFVIGDIFFLSILPQKGISFGPVQPQSLLLFILRIPFMWLPYPINLIFQFLGTALVIIGFIIEPSSVKVTKKVINFNDNPKNQLSFFHLGDIHLEKIGVREKRLLSLLKQHKPDFILFSGDFLNLSYRENPLAIKEVIELFNQINQISPTYWVTGSPAVDLPESIKNISINSQAKWLNNESTLINPYPIELIGLNCTHKPHLDIQTLKSIPREKNKLFSILLYHSPDLLFEIKNEDIDLMLSGHTHGGQVRIPFFGALFTGSLYGRLLQSGSYMRNNTELYITRGIGLEGLGAPRVRFFCPPEIIEWKINF